MKKEIFLLMFAVINFTAFSQVGGTGIDPAFKAKCNTYADAVIDYGKAYLLWSNMGGSGDVPDSTALISAADAVINDSHFETQFNTWVTEEIPLLPAGGGIGNLAGYVACCAESIIQYFDCVRNCGGYRWPCTICPSNLVHRNRECALLNGVDKPIPSSK